MSEPNCAGSNELTAPDFYATEAWATCHTCNRYERCEQRSDGLWVLVEHSRVLPVDPAEDRMYVPEWDDNGRAA